MKVIDVEKLKQALLEDAEIDGWTFARIRMHIEELTVEADAEKPGLYLADDRTCCGLFEEE